MRDGGEGVLDEVDDIRSPRKTSSMITVTAPVLVTHLPDLPSSRLPPIHVRLPSSFLESHSNLLARAPGGGGRGGGGV